MSAWNYDLAGLRTENMIRHKANPNEVKRLVLSRMLMNGTLLWDREGGLRTLHLGWYIICVYIHTT